MLVPTWFSLFFVDRLITALKRTQDHFQLIVITHDEEFVQHLAQGKFCQYYWRVSKDERFAGVVRDVYIDSVLGWLGPGAASWSDKT